MARQAPAKTVSGNAAADCLSEGQRSIVVSPPFFPNLDFMSPRISQEAHEEKLTATINKYKFLLSVISST